MNRRQLFAVLALTFFVASSAAFADDADETATLQDTSPVSIYTPPVTPPVPLVALAAQVWTVQPVVLQLVTILASPLPPLEQVKVLVAQLTPAQLATVVVDLLASPGQVAVLAQAMTAGQAAQVMADLAENPGAVRVLAQAMTVSQAADVMADLAENPGVVKVMADAMSIDQMAKVVAALASNPAAVKVVAAQLDGGKWAQVKVDLFLSDIAGWEAVTDFLTPPGSPKKTFSVDWLDAARAKLQAKILRDGYTPEHLAEVTALIKKAAQ
jgi:hypothetical protein